MQDRTPTRPNRVLVRPEDGSHSFYATITRADEPTRTGDPLNKNTFLKDSTAELFGLDASAVPDDVFYWIGTWGKSSWRLLAQYASSGTYTFNVPDDIDELGVFILGGGYGGGAESKNINVAASAYGGQSGGLKQVVLKKSLGEFSANEKISVVVGAGGTGAVATYGYTVEPIPGGISSFNGIESEGGQIADFPNGSDAQKSPYGLAPHRISNSNEYTPIRNTPYGYNGRNIFDLNDTHIYCGAGGSAYHFNRSDGADIVIAQETVLRAKGGAGAGATGATKGGNATAPGDGGGGAAASHYNGSATGGNGADGLVLVYGRIAL